MAKMAALAMESQARTDAAFDRAEAEYFRTAQLRREWLAALDHAASLRVPSDSAEWEAAILDMHEKAAAYAEAKP